MDTEHIGPMIKAINSQIQKHINNTLGNAPVGLPLLTGTQHEVLAYLFNNSDKEIFQSELDKIFNLSRPTINGIIKRLSRAGMVSITQSNVDHRYKQIKLTQEAKTDMIKYKPKIDEDINFMEEKLTEGLTSQEVETIRAVLPKMLTNLKKLDEKSH